MSSHSHLPHSAFGGTVSAIVHNHLFMPGRDTELRPVKIAAGQMLQAGSVMGRITASQEYVLSDASASDGSQVPRAMALRCFKWVA